MVGNGSRPVWIDGNRTLDLFALSGGFIKGWSNKGHLGSCNPQNRTFANDRAYIAIDNN